MAIISEAAVKKKILAQIQSSYLHECSDIEATGATDFCTFFDNKYGHKKDELKCKFVHLESLLAGGGFNLSAPQNIVVDSDPHDVPEFLVAPWQLGFTSAHSVKGGSKLVHIMDIIDGFLAKPYNSKNEPLQVLFGPRSKVGDPIEDWSMVLSVGMGKSSAARMILEAACETNLTVEEIHAVGPYIKSLLRMRCTYEPAASEEEQLQIAMARKNQITERPRPDPLMWATRWAAIFLKLGLEFNREIDGRIKSFNKDRTEGFGILDYEVAFIKAYAHQPKDFVKLLEQHWQNFKVNESAVPPRRLALADLSPDTKITRCEKTNELWSKILKWTPASNTAWLQREIGTFLRNIKDAQRSGKKINLRTNAKAFRSKVDVHNHDEVCLFTYFIPDFKQHATQQQFDDMYTRMTKGYLDKELNEKCKVMDEELSVFDFRFLSVVTGQQNFRVAGLGSQVVMDLEEKAQNSELQLFKAKLQKETHLWENYQRNLKQHETLARECRRMAAKELDEEITKVATDFVSIIAPTMRCTEDGVVPLICDSVARWADREKLSKERIYTCLIVRFDVLGGKFFANLNPALRIVSDLLNTNPSVSAAVIVAPNTGKGDTYNEASIQEAQDDVEHALKQDQWSCRIKRGYFNLAEESIGGAKSRRPGVCPVWLMTSDARDAKGEPVTNFKNSHLFKRGNSLDYLTCLRYEDFLNPCQPMLRPGGGTRLSKSQRSKQWHTGKVFWDGVRSSVLTGLGLSSCDGVAWVDLLPYDDKLQHSVIMAYGEQSVHVPSQCIISTVWANMGVQGPDSVEKVDNERVSKFVLNSNQAFASNRVRDGSLKFDGLDVASAKNASANQPPTYDVAMFVQTCPNATGALPLRQAILDLMRSKITKASLAKEVEDVVAVHNKSFNPSGVPYKGEKRPVSEVQGANPEEEARAKVYGPEDDGPKSAADFGANSALAGVANDHEFYVNDGKLYVHGLQDCVVSDQKPLLRLWGEYICGADKKKEITKFKSVHYMWEMKTPDFVATFDASGDKGNDDAALFKDGKPSTLTEFLVDLEGKGKVNIKIECHKLEDSQAEVQGLPVTTYKISSVEDCLFVAKTLPPRVKMSKSNAVSCMDFSQWNFVNLTHKRGRVKLIPGLSFSDEHKAIVPVKPAMYVTEPVKVKKGEVVLLG